MFVKEYMTKTPIVLSTKDDVKDAFALLLENRILIRTEKKHM